MKSCYIAAASWLLLAAVSPAAEQPQAAAEATQAAPIAPEAKPVFDVFDFQIDGNTVLDDESLERAVYPYLGPEKTVDDMEKARAALEEAYRNAGYQTVIVSVPPQDINEGQVRIEVTEGSIEIQHISGSRYHNLDKIRDGVPALAEGQVPHMPTVQKQVTALAQQSADRTVTPIFRAGATPGKMEVELRVKDELPLHGSVEMNSRQSGHTSYSRLLGSIRYDNLWQAFHSASLQYQVSPEISDQVSVWSGTYVLPTGWFDTRLALYGIGISSNTPLGSGLGTSIGGTSVLGAGSIYGARLVKPLPIKDEVVQNVTAGFDYKSFDQAGTSSAIPASAIQYASFMTAYDLAWRNDMSATAVNFTGHLSFRGLGNDAVQFANKRKNHAGVGASPDFLYLTASLKNQLKLPWDFQLLSRLQGQASSTFLIANEQFSAGGPQSVRGYYQSQMLGDNALNLSIELQSPKLVSNEWESMQNLRALGFAEWAGSWASQQSIANNYSQIASFGLGLRMKMFKSLTGEFDWAYPLRACNLGCTTAANVVVGQQRVDFRMLYEF